MAKSARSDGRKYDPLLKRVREMIAEKRHRRWLIVTDALGGVIRASGGIRGRQIGLAL